MSLLKLNKKSYASVIILIAGWLIIVNIFALLALNRFNLESDTAYKWINSKPSQQSWDIVNLHARWDSGGYLSIAQNGYTQAQPNLAAFFPIYPLLIKIAGTILGGNFILGGWLISIIFLFLSGLVLYKIIQEFHPKANPLLGVLMLLVFPSAFFLNAVYTESVFLFFTLATFYYLHKKKFLIAALFGLAASLTKIIGIALIVPFIIELFIHYKYFKERLKGILQSLIILLGPISFFIFHLFYYGRFNHFFKVQAAWGRQFSFNKGHFTFETPPEITNFILEILLVILCLIAAFVVINKIQKSYGFYMLALLLIPISTGTLFGINRYIVVIFPLFIFGAYIKKEIPRSLWLMTSTLLFSLYIVLFVNGYWAG